MEVNGQPWSVEVAAQLRSKAVELAMMAHGRQKYGPLEYAYHLRCVENVIRRFFKSDKPYVWALRTAAWLHDIVEDTDITLEVVRASFGEYVADMVYGVTDEPGKNRKERKAATLSKTAAKEMRVILKLADRIANTEEGLAWDNSLIDMYRKEYPSFREALYNPDHKPKVHRMWSHLDRLMDYVA